MDIDSFHPLILNVGKAVHDSDWNWQNICSPFARIYYIVQGEAALVIGGQTHRLCPLHLYLIPPFTAHSTVCTSHFIHYYIHVYEEGTAGNDIFEEYDFPFEVSMQPNDEYLFERLVRLNPAMPIPASDPSTYDNSRTLVQNTLQSKMLSDELKIESRGIIYQLFSRFIQKASAKAMSHDARITKATHYVMEHLSDHISIRELASEACLSPEHFIRIFKNITGTTPMQYITRKRMEKSQHLLFTTNMSIKNIAFTLGYTDSSYFVRVFKCTLGITPQEYRKQQNCM
ncbi:MAG: AraC family transcriptional regulator [Paraprevotella sp.]|nr:AraC family transcriptional regulator [Paraprevotella sp.]